MCANAYMRVFAYAWACREVSDQCWGVFLFTPELICSDSQLLSPKLLFQWNWLSSKSLGSTCLNPRTLRYRSVSPNMPSFYMGAKDLNSGPHAHRTHTLPTDQRLWPKIQFSLWKKKKKTTAKYFIIHFLLSLENGKLICMPNKLSEDKFLYDSLVLTRLHLKSHRRHIHVYKDVSSKL